MKAVSKFEISHPHRAYASIALFLYLAWRAGTMIR